MATELMIVEPIVGELVESGPYCPQCGDAGDPPDAYCRRCGFGLNTPALVHNRQPPASSTLPIATSVPVWLGRRSVVIGLLLFVGPLGLPALWLSPRFSLPAKVITSLAYAAVTIALPIALTFYWLHVAMLPLVEAFPPVTR